MEKQDIVSIDTNVLVRFLVEDEGTKGQCQSAMQLFMRHAVFIPESVFLETEWVLRAVYRVRPHEICSAFHKVLGLAQIIVADKSLLKQALAYYETGFDFADALHLLRGEGYEMKTFDAAFIRKAQESGYLASSP